jgi:hypothetical protein
VSNAAVIGSLANQGAIIGGNGCYGSMTDGDGGAGLSNAGTIGTLTNSGAIGGGNGGSGPAPGAAGDATASTGSIGPIINSGRIIGNVVIDNQASVTVSGGARGTFGQWTGGAIKIAKGDLLRGRHRILHANRRRRFGSWNRRKRL